MAKSIFCGREWEMAQLMAAFRKASAPQPETQVAVLLAESGLGKTRIAQEFYNWLSTVEDGVEGDGYWPDVLDQEGNNLRVNPSLTACNNAMPMPFLWWGIRLSDPGARNEVSTGSLVAALPDLKPHLEPMYWELRRRERGRTGAKNTGDAALDVAIEFANAVSGLGVVKAVGKAVFEIYKLGRNQTRDSSSLSIGDIASQHVLSLTDSLVSDFRTILGDGDYSSRVPAIIFLDDAQFSLPDPGLTNAFAALLDAALAERWPLLFLITHWETEWHLQAADTEAATVARIVVERSKRLAPDWKPMSIGKVGDLSRMVTNALPGLRVEQRSAVLARADGNPRYLQEIIEYARLRPRLFELRDTNQALTKQGEIELADGAVDLRNLVAQRLSGNPPEVQAAIALGSLQGTEFMRSVVEQMGTSLRADGLGYGLEQAELPYAYIRSSRHPVASFAQGIYREVAADRLPDLFEVEDAREALKEIIRSRLDDPTGFALLSNEERMLTRRLAVMLFDVEDAGDDRQRGVQALSDELVRLRGVGDIWGAAMVARKLLATVAGGPEVNVDIDVLESAALALVVAGQGHAAIAAYDRLIDVLNRRSAAPVLVPWRWDDGDPLRGFLLPLLPLVDTPQPDFSYEPKLASIYSSRGLLHFDFARYALAEIDHTTSIEISERQKIRLGVDWTIFNENWLANGYHNRAMARGSLGDQQGQLADYGSAINLRETAKLSCSPEDWISSYEDWLANGYEGRGLARKQAGQTGALQDQRRAIEIREELKARYGETWPSDFEAGLANNYANLASTRLHLKDTAGAIEDQTHAIDLLSSLKKKDAAVWPPVRELRLGNYYHSRAFSRNKIGDPTGAIADYTKVIAIWTEQRTLLQDDWPISYANDLANAYASRALLRRSRKDIDGSVEDFSQEIQLREESKLLFGNRWTLSDEYLLSNSYVDRGMSLVLITDLRAAKADISRGINIRTAVKDRLGSSWTKAQNRQLALTYMTRAKLLLFNFNFALAWRDWRTALQLERTGPG